MEDHTPERLSPDPQKELASQRIAILFTDLKGSTAFYKIYGNIAGRIMIQKLNDMLFPVVRAYKGSVVKTIGDSIMASFPAPKEALWSAIAMQKRLQAYNMEHNDARDQMLIRIAINYGYGLVEEKDVFGDVVNVAGKLISCCDAQDILVTEAFYLEVQNTSEVTFSSFQIKDKKKDIEKLGIYKVNWEKTEQTTESPNLYLFSLRIEKTSGNGMPAESIQKILPLISRSASKVINADETEINAVFQSPRACIEAAQKAIQNYLNISTQGSELPHVLKIGLHSVEKGKADAGSALTIFEEPIRARDSAEPYEIVLTSEFYNDLTSDLKHVCVPAQDNAEARSQLYLFQGARTGAHTSVFTSILPDAGSALQGALCFYCGCSQHAADRCPSKLIRETTAYLEKLGYMPLHRIRQKFQEHFPDIVKPLKSGSEEERFDVLFHEKKDDPYALCFFSFYEISEMFQLRSQRRLFYKSASKKDLSSTKTGALLMGEDCLRVSRFEEALDWFEKAIREQPNDYRPHVFLGLLSVEKSDYEQALFHFKKAGSFPLTAMQKRHIECLIARIYELSGSLPSAQQEIEGSLAMFHDWTEGMYYKGVLLIKSGNIKQAIAIFKRLLYQSPRYYFMLSLNMEMSPAKMELMAFLNRELINMRARAQKSFDSIRKTMQAQAAFFEKNDEGFKEADGLFQKAAQIIQEESISGLMDLPGFEINIALLLSRALEFRTKILKEKIRGYKKNAEKYAAYLVRFPYRNLLSQKDFSLNKNFESLFDGAKKAADAAPPPSIQEGRAFLDRLKKAAEKLAANQKRLEIIKKMFFVLECALRMAAFFFTTVLITAFSFAVILTLYQGYETSVFSITAAQLLAFTRFGLFAGLVLGIVGTTIWFAKNFSAMYKKIE